MDFLAHLRDLIAEREATRRHIDADLRDLRAVLARHEGGQAATLGARSDSGVQPASRGEARAALLDLMADGAVWTPRQVAARLGKRPAAASTLLRRALAAGQVVEARPGVRGAYRIASANGSPKEDPAGADSLWMPPESQEGVTDLPVTPSGATNSG